MDPPGRQGFFIAGHLSEAERADPAERPFRVAVGRAAPTGAGPREQPSLEAGQRRQAQPGLVIGDSPVLTPAQLLQAIPAAVLLVTIELGTGDHASVELAVVM